MPGIGYFKKRDGIMKRIVIFLLCLSLSLSLCACAGQNPALEYAAECWEEMDANQDEMYKIYIMEYTSKAQLGGEMESVSFWGDIPQRGYVVIFYDIWEKYVGFLSDDGDVELLFDYQENRELSEELWRKFTGYNDLWSGERSNQILHDCNCVSDLINDAYESDENPLGGKLEENVWYSLSQRQIEKVID